MGGRPTKLTPALQDKIVQAIRAGNYMETAAAYAGIHKDTLYAWLKRGARERSPHSPYRQFSDAVEKALAEAEVRDVALIAKAAEREWQAAAWRLERKFPDRWGRRERVQATVTATVSWADLAREAAIESARDD
jgi:transposase